MFPHRPALTSASLLDLRGTCTVLCLDSWFLAKVREVARMPPALSTHVQDLVRATPGISLARLVQEQPQLSQG